MAEVDVLKEYDEQLPRLSELGAAALERLQSLLAAHRPSIHSVTHRVKSRESLKRKLERPDRIYRALRDVTDLVGVRIITYFEDTTFQVAAALEQVLSVDFDHSHDKRQMLHPTEFGYRSLHYVCRWPDADGLRFEIQIRTILQHAWAEIEHDLGYKSEASVPASVKRRFSRLASLLELADEEFLGIRRQLQDYERSVLREGPEGLRQLPLDRVSLEAFVRTELAHRTDQAIALQLGLPLSSGVFHPDYLVQMLRQVGIGHVEALARALETRAESVLAFVPFYFECAQEMWGFASKDLDRVDAGYALVFLAHLVLLGGSELELDRVGRVTDFFSALDYGGDRAPAGRVAVRLLEAHRAFRAAMLERKLRAAGGS